MAAGGAAQMPAIGTTQALGDAVCHLASAVGQLKGRYRVLKGWMDLVPVATLAGWRTVRLTCTR